MTIESALLGFAMLIPVGVIFLLGSKLSPSRSSSNPLHGISEMYEKVGKLSVKLGVGALLLYFLAVLSRLVS